jgi:hypothetical protein
MRPESSSSASNRKSNPCGPFIAGIDDRKSPDSGRAIPIVCKEEDMLSIIILLLLIFGIGYGGYRVGPGWGYYGGGGLSLILAIVLILVLLKVF